MLFRSDNIATVRGKNKSKQLPWFRFYTEALDDPKVQRLPPHLFKTWVNLLCIAGKNNGKLPSIDDIAFKLRLSSQDAEQQLSELILAGLIDITDEGRSPHNWAARQYVSDCSTERVRKYREKKAETQCNVSVTASETAPEQIQNRTDPEDAQAREPGGQVDRQWAEAYCRGIDIKGGKTAKSARAQLRTKGELDGSTGITLENGKLSVTNGSSAALASEFPGIDLAGESPKRLTDALSADADVVVTMGCGDACPYILGKRYLDWQLDDPAGQPLQVVRRIRDDVRAHVQQLLDDLTAPPADGKA